MDRDARQPISRERLRALRESAAAASAIFILEYAKLKSELVKMLEAEQRLRQKNER